MSDAQEQRRYTRASVNFGVELRLDDLTCFPLQCQDLSLKGIFVTTDTAFPEGTECQVTLFPASGIGIPNFQISGRVVRAMDAGMGIEFLEIPLQNLDYLYNLILQQAPETKQMEEELESVKGGDIFLL